MTSTTNRLLTHIENKNINKSGHRHDTDSATIDDRRSTSAAYRHLSHSRLRRAGSTATDYDSEGITISFEHLLLRDPIYLSDEEKEDSKQGAYAEFMIPKPNKEKGKAKEEDVKLTYVSPIKHDPGSYSLPFSVSNKFKGLALIDSGAALNMMLVSYCRKMKIKKLTPTTYQYRGINGYMTTPLGIAKVVPIRIGNFVYLTDFVVADLPKDTEIPIILGSVFLHTAQVNLDMYNQFGTSEVENEEIRPETEKVKNGNSQISRLRTFKFRDAESIVLGTSRRKLFFPDMKFQFLVLQFFDSMASKIKTRQIVVPRTPDWTLLQTLEIDGDVKAVLEKHAIGENRLEYYICKAWDRVFNINEILYRELILGFVATYTFNPIKATEDCREKCITFRLGRIWRTLLLAEFGVAWGIYTQAEVNDPDFEEYMVATSKTPKGFNPREVWDIFCSGNFSSNIKVKGLLSPLDRLLHRMLVYAVNSHSSNEEKIPVYDLWLLSELSTDNRYPNAPCIIAVQLQKAGGYRSGTPRERTVEHGGSSSGAAAMEEPEDWNAYASYQGMMQQLSDLQLSFIRHHQRMEYNSTKTLHQTNWQSGVLNQVAEHLGVQPTPTYVHLRCGIAEDVMVQVDKFVFPADFMILDIKDEVKVPLILGRPFLNTASAIIHVAKRELSLGIGELEESFSIEKIWDEAMEREEEEFEELKQEDKVRVRTSLEEPPNLELKDLPEHLEYQFLEGNNSVPVIIFDLLTANEKEKLIAVLKKHKKALAWKISDIPGISPPFSTHKILMEDNFKPCVQKQRRLNPKMQEVVKKEVIKLLDTGIIYPISDSPWVSAVQVVPKKGGLTVVTNDNNELVPTRTVTGWRVCIDYRKLNDATRKDHFPLPFIDQMLERLAGNEYYCFLDGFSRYFQIPIDPED
ncbi:hypothetical protein OSB04_029087 [Centaurea solstitialis]|uniref:Reverse transcriptase domain-containing protein n=1 Tax=Centaurea solstitialis TaxID=347529 RepID=A0AA38SVD6_9ASTR|nr:hypothetical protein OSB04_029087 [Centaurea solstitialis]